MQAVRIPDQCDTHCQVVQMIQREYEELYGDDLDTTLPVYASNKMSKLCKVRGATCCCNADGSGIIWPLPPDVLQHKQGAEVVHSTWACSGLSNHCLLCQEYNKLRIKMLDLCDQYEMKLRGNKKLKRKTVSHTLAPLQLKLQPAAPHAQHPSCLLAAAVPCAEQGCADADKQMLILLACADARDRAEVRGVGPEGVWEEAGQGGRPAVADHAPGGAAAPDPGPGVREDPHHQLHRLCHLQVRPACCGSIAFGC